MDILRGIIGILGIVALGWLFSKNRNHINWRTVILGILLQIVIAIFILKVPFFTHLFKTISNVFVVFLGFALEGSAFLFGDLAKNSLFDTSINHNLGFVFAFQALPIVIFFSAVTAVLYYYGILQKIVHLFARVMKYTLHLSGAESLSAAGNIFMGQTEAPLLVRPFIPKMTKSELHCLMTGGMATIAGSVLGAYVAILGGGSEAEQVKFATFLLGASLMNAPAAIVLSKMFYPEKLDHAPSDDMTISNVDLGVNFVDVLGKGATDGLKLALNIGAMLLVFIAVVHLFNWILIDGIGNYLGLNEMISKSTHGVYKGFSLEYILGQVFRYFAFLMGVEWSETIYVGSLLGQKFVINEFVAYLSLSEWVGANVLSQKSLLISTYALCGFANFSSIAIQIGGIGVMAPSRREDISRLGFRSLIAASLATMLSATIAGALY